MSDSEIQPDKADLPSDEPESVAFKPTVTCEPDATERYASMLEAAAVATLFRIMSSSKASPSLQHSVAMDALEVVGKRRKAESPKTPGTVVMPIMVAPSAKQALSALPTMLQVLERVPTERTTENAPAPEVRILAERPADSSCSTDSQWSDNPGGAQ